MYSKLDVNVPHGKAATETLMLRTVVSLASDDPGPELLETRRGEEQRRRRGSYDVTAPATGSDGRGTGASPGQCQCQDQAWRCSGLGREMLQCYVSGVTHELSKSRVS